MRDYADAVRSGAAAGQGWPEWINIPSKIGQVAAVRIYARDQREQAMRDGQLIVGVCPGLVDTRTSRPWFTDMSQAQAPGQAATDVVKLATGPIEPQMYGELVQHGRTLPGPSPPRPRRQHDLDAQRPDSRRLPRSASPPTRGAGTGNATPADLVRHRFRVIPVSPGPGECYVALRADRAVG